MKTILMFAVIIGLFVYTQKPDMPDKLNDVKGQVSAKLPALDYKLTDNSITIPNLLKETNKQRTNAGLPELTLDTRLNTSAANKCEDHKTYDYWAHDNPNTSVLWESFLLDVPYISAGENLAHGFYTSKQVTVGWMNSQLHRDNLLNNSYDSVGFGICDDEKLKTIVVQHFIEA